MDSEDKKELLSLIFDSDIIYQISYNMCVNALKKPEKQKQEEDLYVIEKNLGEVNRFFKELKKQNNWSNYMNLVRHLEYVQMPKYSTVFNYEEASDKIYLIMKGEVCVLLPDNFYENNRYSMEIKRNAQKKLLNLQTKHKELKQVFEQHQNPDFTLKKNFKNPNDEERDEDEQKDEESLQPWGTDISVISLIHPELFCANILQTNQHFGEIGVEFNAPRSATIVCKTDCEFAVLPSKAYHTLINHRFYSEDKFVTKLRNVNDIFKIMSKEMITIFASETQVQICNRDKADYIYFISKGEVEISQMYNGYDIKTPSDDLEVNSSYLDLNTNSIADFQQCKLKTAILTEGCYFGEDGIIFRTAEGIRVTSATAKIQSALLKIKKDFFYNNFKALIESEKLSEKIVQDNLTALHLKTQENEEMEQYYGSSISKKQKEKNQKTKEQKSKQNITSQQTIKQDHLRSYHTEEEQVLKNKNIKKNLFELYNDEKNRIARIIKNTLSPISVTKIQRGGSLSPIKVQRSTLKIDNEVQGQFESGEEYLYPNINYDMNQDLFVKKQKKSKRVRKSNGSISQLSTKSPRDLNSTTLQPIPTLQQLFGTEQFHSYIKVPSSQAFANSLQTLTKIVNNTPKINETKSNQLSPLKPNTPLFQQRAQSATKIKINSRVLDSSFKNNNSSIPKINVQGNNEQQGIKIMENGQLIQEFTSPRVQQILLNGSQPQSQEFNNNNNNNNKSNYLGNPQSYLNFTSAHRLSFLLNPASQQSFQQIQQCEDTPNTVEKPSSKTNLYFHRQRNDFQRKSFQSSGGYEITRSLKEESLLNDKSGLINKSRLSQSQIETKNNSKTREKLPIKDKYGIDSKYLVKEKLNFLVNPKQPSQQYPPNINTQNQRPLIKFKSITTIPYQQGLNQINQVKKVSTINVKELVRQNKSLASHQNNQNNSHSISPLLKGNQFQKNPIHKMNSNQASFLALMRQSMLNPNGINVSKKLNSSAIHQHIQ